VQTFRLASCVFAELVKQLDVYMTYSTLHLIDITLRPTRWWPDSSKLLISGELMASDSCTVWDVEAETVLQQLSQTLTNTSQKDFIISPDGNFVLGFQLKGSRAEVSVTCLAGAVPEMHVLYKMGEVGASGKYRISLTYPTIHELPLLYLHRTVVRCRVHPGSANTHLKRRQPCLRRYYNKMWSMPSSKDCFAKYACFPSLRLSKC
jgi:hypothetical protein